ncbi:hypothetical protein L1987_13039 [Smallanthus sonchifolius]|uniref:Uncharacterized protein n=1 Tax=Smallanthus sonchifolius TaxID=185202 RepID=A0ACB9JG95_9ASTR|nr:hypothetical protein L1987_13039 [Smallanthus sonchifolius]
MFGYSLRKSTCYLLQKEEFCLLLTVSFKVGSSVFVNADKGTCNFDINIDADVKYQETLIFSMSSHQANQINNFRNLLQSIFCW